MSRSILVDVTKCTGCEQCVAACVEANAGDPRRADLDRLTSRDGLSAERRATVSRVADGRFARKSCMHCLEPSCVSACLVGGITKDPDGPVIYDPAKCIGCRYCMLACPFHVPRYEWDETAPLMVKCDMCAERVDDGRDPACVAACPAGALTFGDRNELLAEAHRRLAGDRAGYIQHVWGEHEFGGTSVLYISDVDLATRDWPAASPGAIPHPTEPLFASTPFIGLGVMSSLLGVSWVIRRRRQLERENDSHE